MENSSQNDEQPEGLQKLTDSPSNNTGGPTLFGEILHALNRKHPVEDNSREAMNRCINKILEEAINHPLMPDRDKAALRGQLWERNHFELIAAMNNFMFEHNRMPSVTELAIKTGLSRTSVYKHLGNFTKEASYHAQIEQFQMMTGQVLTMLYKLAVNGDVKAAKTYLDAVGGVAGLNQSKASKPGAESSNYIQVNNNVKIDQVTFATLPNQVQQQIADLVLQGLQASSTPVHEVRADYCLSCKICTDEKRE